MATHADNVDLVGVRFDGAGRAVGQAGACSRLREAGLAAAIPGARFVPDITVSDPSPRRGPVGGFVNEQALLEMVDAVDERAQASIREGRFPLLYGGDCAVLLGAVPAVRATSGSAGLLFVDAHEDATTMEQTTTGEAANMEVALLLGMTGQHAPEPLRRRLPTLEYAGLVMLGQRDAGYRREIEVDSIADRVRVHAAHTLHDDAGKIAAAASAQISAHAEGWWLHVDLDVLDRDEFRACGAAGDPSMPPGLTWAQLTAITKAALHADRCRGWSVGVYNADLDPDGRDARRIVSYLSEALEPLPTAG